jgi:hypothetical protein
MMSGLNSVNLENKIFKIVSVCFKLLILLMKGMFKINFRRTMNEYFDILKFLTSNIFIICLLYYQS